MDVMHRQTPPLLSSSRLNPNAPIFVPMAAYQAVEDFSSQWWDLVQSSPCFRDYWLHDCFEDPQPQDPHLFPDDKDDDLDLNLPDFDAFFDLYSHKQEMKEEEEEEEVKKIEKELITIGALKWNRSGGRGMEPSRNIPKAPKIVKSVKVSPRNIHQPR